jgi:hypothetical protein
VGVVVQQIIMGVGVVVQQIIMGVGVVVQQIIFTQVNLNMIQQFV